MLGKRRSKIENTSARTARIERGGTPKTFSYYGSRPTIQTTRRQDAATTSRVRNAASEHSATTRPRPLRTMQPLKLGLLLVGCLLCARLLYLQTTPDIQVSSDSVQVTSTVESTYVQDAKQLLSSSVLNRFKLTLDTQGIAAQLKSKHPEIRYASVSSPVFGAAPRVNLTLMDSVALLQTAGATYGLDATGHVLAASQGRAELPVVIDEADVVPVPDERFLPASTVGGIVTIVEQMSAANLDVTTVTLPRSNPYALVVRLRDKPYAVHFNLESDLLQQSGAVVATIKHLGDATPKEYLDVRVLGRVYYK